MTIKRGFYFLLLITIIGEFVLPWILKYFYEGYNSKTMVLSVLGSPESPVRKIYNAWLIWLGLFLLLTAWVMYGENRQISAVWAALISAVIIFFAIGAGILAGLFSVNESKNMVTFASKIHGAGAAIGFMALLFFPLLNSLLAFENGNRMQGVIYVLAFLCALIFFAFFIMGDKEQFKETVFSWEGLWERLALFFMYVPFIYKAMQNLS